MSSNDDVSNGRPASQSSRRSQGKSRSYMWFLVARCSYFYSDFFFFELASLDRSAQLGYGGRWNSKTGCGCSSSVQNEQQVQRKPVAKRNRNRSIWVWFVDWEHNCWNMAGSVDADDKRDPLILYANLIFDSSLLWDRKQFDHHHRCRV